MKRLGELVNFGFGIYLTIYFTNGETEKDYYLPDESTTRDIKRSLNDLGINSISFEIANKKQKDGSCVFLAGFYHWRDEGMIGWQPSSKTSFNDQMLKDRKLKVDSFKHQSMYTEYGLTPKQY